MLYQRIKKICKERGISIYRLEKDCGFSQNSILKWEKSSPKAENLLKVAEYLDVPSDYLLNRGLFAKAELIEKHFDILMERMSQIELEDDSNPTWTALKNEWEWFKSHANKLPIYDKISFMNLLIKDINFEVKNNTMNITIFYKFK